MKASRIVLAGFVVLCAAAPLAGAAARSGATGSSPGAAVYRPIVDVSRKVVSGGQAATREVPPAAEPRGEAPR